MLLMKATGIRKQFHNREVVRGIDVEIRQGEILALIGTNGAGKSTTLAMLLGILPPDAGTITRWRDDYKAHIGVQLQSTPFFEGYTAEENLRLFAAKLVTEITFFSLSFLVQHFWIFRGKSAEEQNSAAGAAFYRER